jgi:hypothetical protein
VIARQHTGRTSRFFGVICSPRRGTRFNRPYHDESGVIEQFRPGERQARFEAEWDDETENWKFGKRIADA